MPAIAATPEFGSPRAALEQGISAFNGGYYELAIPALEYAAEKDMLIGQHYLGLIYSDNNSVHTDHAKAYLLFQKLANHHADADPDDRARAPYVAHALTALAQYLRNGLKEIGVRPNAKQAAKFLRHAAIFFNHEDAQFELAKLLLKGEGMPSDVARGKHWLSTLAQKGHAGAQAFLADLYWRGKYVREDKVRALTLISVAVKNAPRQDRVWIEDIYQNIYCGASIGVRKQVSGGLIADWDDRYGRKPRYDGRDALGSLDLSPIRTCEDGEQLPLTFQRETLADRDSGTARANQPALMRGSAGGVRNVDTPLDSR